MDGIAYFRHGYLANLLATTEQPRLTRRFVSAIPISVPPWPSEKQSDLETFEIAGLTPQQQGQVMWHDITIDTKARKLMTAGLDGMIGVALVASDSTPALARARALELCARLQVPQLQYRADAGGLVDAAL